MSTYEFDSTGTLLANRVPNEPHTVTTINGTNVNFFFLDAAPFFSDSVTVVDSVTGMSLIPGLDYTFGHEYVHGSSQVGKPLFGSVVLLDPNRGGTFLATYNTLGGEFVTPGNLLLEDGLSTLNDLRNIRWEDLDPVTIPSEFPPTPHSHQFTGVEGAQELLEQLAKMVEAIENQPKGIKLADVVDLDANFTAPLITALSNISTNLEALRSTSGLYSEESNGLGELLEINSPIIGTWYNTNIKVSPISAGLYQVTLMPELSATWSGTAGRIEKRLVLNGLPLNVSRSNVFTLNMSAGQELKMQVRIVSQPASKLIYSSPTDVTALMALRIKDILPE